MGKCGEQTRAADQPDIPNDLTRPSKEPQNKEVILANRRSGASDEDRSQPTDLPYEGRVKN